MSKPVHTESVLDGWEAFMWFWKFHFQKILILFIFYFVFTSSVFTRFFNLWTAYVLLAVGTWDLEWGGIPTEEIPVWQSAYSVENSELCVCVTVVCHQCTICVFAPLFINSAVPVYCNNSVRVYMCLRYGRVINLLYSGVVMFWRS